ncbi:MAG: response regulator [Candidatus Krumholzibacteriales bacterium]
MKTEDNNKKRDLKILIVEDDETARNVTARYLSDFGECDIAPDGEVAMELFLESRAGGRPYDVIFLDILMPNMSGRKVLDRIRDIEDHENISERDRTRVIITSSLSDPGSISGAFKSRCEGYLVKPFGREDLERQLQSLEIIKYPS